MAKPVRKILRMSAVAVILAGWLVLATPASAGVVSADCANTTYVDGSTETTRDGNFGSQPDLIVNGARKYALLECSVAGIPKGATGVSATLDVFSRWMNTPHTVRLHDVATSWAESSVTWNTMPGFDAVVLSSANGDLVPGASEWVRLTAPNVTGNGTFRFALDTASTSDQVYASDDYDNTIRLPRLTVTYSPPPPMASFTLDTTRGDVPLTVQFTDTSTNDPTAWSWDFGDGTQSTARNPSHTYGAAGTYGVTLTASNSAGSDQSAPRTVTVNSLSQPSSDWATVVNDQFDADGPVPPHWGLYDGPYGSGARNCADRSHNYVSGGALHLLMSYDTSLPACGGDGATYPATRWYTGGMELDRAYASVDQRVTLRMRNVLTDPAASADPATGVRSQNNAPVHLGDTQSPCWPAGGEIDYNKGTNPTTYSPFIHYGGTCLIGSTVAGADYPVDWRNWHTIRVERKNHAVKVWIDDMVTPRYTRTGDALMFPDVLQRLVLRQECRSAGCPATSPYRADLQIDYIVVENPANPQPSGPVSPTGSWRQVFGDEFNGTAVNSGNWIVIDGQTVNNVVTKASNVSVSDGLLRIQLSSRDGTIYGGVLHSDANWAPGYPQPGRYNAAVGHVVEARVFLPGDGTTTQDCYNFPAFWTSGSDWPNGGENDIWECLTSDDVSGRSRHTINYHGVESVSPADATQYADHGAPDPGCCYGNGWHTATLYRNPNGTSMFYVDGVLQRTVSTASHEAADSPQSVILSMGKTNNAVRGNVLGGAGAIKFDWVRAYAPA